MTAVTNEKTEDYKVLVKEAVCREETFLRLVANGKIRGATNPWLKAVVRPVELKGQRKYQFSYFDSKRDLTHNYAKAGLVERLEELLAKPFNRIHVQAVDGDLHIRITKKGKVLITKGKPSRPEEGPDLAHNRVKRHLLPGDTPDAFLQGIGIMGGDGKIKPTMQNKFRQINEFLKLLDQMLGPGDLSDKELTLVDCGCGSAYLTFAGYHYLNHLRGISTRVVGIDRDLKLIEKCNQLRDTLGWSGLQFIQSSIDAYVPEAVPDIVLSLHACNTATDEAIAQGVRWQSPIILAAPCCQHELRPQLEAPLFGPVLKDGILKQRTADILTDACRAQVLRILGYRTDVVQFIDSKHTAKNLMIRAQKTAHPVNQASVTEYRALRDFWKITPSIEKLLKRELEPYM